MTSAWTKRWSGGRTRSSIIGGRVGPIELIARSIATDRVKRNWGMLERASAAPAMIRAVTQASLEIDLRDVLTPIQVPAIVVAREGSFQPRAIPEHVADLIPRAEFDWQPEAKPSDGVEGFMAPFMDAVERMVAGGRTVRRTRRILTTVLFTDIVGSAELASTIGDRAWRNLLDRHEELLREHVADAGGRVVKMIGDGSLSLFDGPARAIRCAHDFAAAAQALNIGVRAGLHTGECELVDDDVTGLAVHIGARVGGLASAGEVLVSRTVRSRSRLRSRVQLPRHT
jgi:Adenylate and Guanylate cyclase catalytic domain